MGDARELRFVYGGGGYVYLLLDEVAGLYKVGASSQLRLRLKMLAGGSCNPLRLVWYVATNDHIRLECGWHDHWRTNRVNGEWFRLSDASVAGFKALRAVEFSGAAEGAYVPVGDPLAEPRGGRPRRYAPLRVGELIHRPRVS